ncbi:MAG: DUF222 domain-containing protein [Actinomycetes bacterium]
MSIDHASPAADAALAEWEWEVVLSAPPSLLDADPATLTLTGQLDFLAEVQRQRSWLASLESRALVAIAGGEPQTREVTVSGGVSVEIIDERIDLVAAALRRSALTVRRQVHRARLMRRGLAATRAALETGSISPEHADVIARAAEGIEPGLLADFESRVLAKAHLLTSAETAAFARRVRARVDAAGEERRRQAARRHVDVRVWAEDDGLACLVARLPLTDASRIHAAIEAGARRVEAPCDASLGERRVAALVRAVCSDPGDQASSAVRAEIGVTVDLATMLGLSDDPVLITLGSGPAEPATAAALHDLLADPEVPVALRRLVTDPMTGELLDRGRASYRVTDALRSFLVARDGTCRFPGCMRRATACEIDHAVSWDRGGSTDRANLGPLCIRHHLLKTHAGWTFHAARPDGATEWLGPDGREYVSHQLDRLLARWGRSESAHRPPTGRVIRSRPRGSPDPPPF